MQPTSPGLPPRFGAFARSAGESAYPDLWRGLIGCWAPMLGPQGITTLPDLSAYKGHGTLNGTMTGSDWVIAPTDGYALDFDGTDDSATLSRLALTEGASQLSWVIRFKPVTLASDRALMAKANINAETQMCWTIGYGTTGFTGTNEIFVRIPTSSTDINTIGATDEAIMANGVWAHLVVVFDGTLATNGDRLKIYFDGKIRTLSFSGTIPAATVASTALARIAAFSDAVRPAAAQIQSALIYNRALTSKEVTALYRGASPLILERRTVGKAPAGGSEFSGTTSLTFGASGALAGTGALAGATSLTFSATGAIAGTGSIAGATSLTFSISGALAGAGGISGSTGIVFVVTGTLNPNEQAPTPPETFVGSSTGALCPTRARNTCTPRVCPEPTAPSQTGDIFIL